MHDIIIEVILLSPPFVVLVNSLFAGLLTALMKLLGVEIVSHYTTSSSAVAADVTNVI